MSDINGDASSSAQNLTPANQQLASSLNALSLTTPTAGAMAMTTPPPPPEQLPPGVNLQIRLRFVANGPPPYHRAVLTVELLTRNVIFSRMVVGSVCHVAIRANTFLLCGESAFLYACNDDSIREEVRLLDESRPDCSLMFKLVRRTVPLAVGQMLTTTARLVMPPQRLGYDDWYDKFFPERRLVSSECLQSVGPDQWDYLCRGIWGNNELCRMDSLAAFHHVEVRWRNDNDPNRSPPVYAGFYKMISFFRIGNFNTTLALIRRLDRYRRTMPEDLLRDYYAFTSRICYNLGNFEESRQCLEESRRYLRAADSRADCFLESALLNAHSAALEEEGTDGTVGATFVSNALKDFEQAVKLFDFSGDTTSAYNKLFAKFALYSLLCYCFTSHEAFRTISSDNRRTFDVPYCVRKIIREVPPIVGFNFNVWCHEALVRGMLRDLEHGAEVTSNLLRECLDFVIGGFNICKAYGIVQNMPGIYNAALMLAAVTDSPLARNGAVFMAQRIGFTPHTRLEAPCWTVRLTPETRQKIRDVLRWMWWDILWDDLIKQFDLPMFDDEIEAGYEPEPDAFSEDYSENIAPRQLLQKDMLTFRPNQPAIYDRARRMFLEGTKLSVAIILLDRLLRHNPAHHEARRLKQSILAVEKALAAASKALAEGDGDRAAAAYEQALAVAPAPSQLCGRLHCKCASMQYTFCNYDRALRECQLAIENAPQLGEAYLWRARCHVIKQQFDDAVRDFNSAKEFDPTLDVESELEQARRRTPLQDHEFAKLYDILELPRGTRDINILKRAYRRLSLEYHPDNAQRRNWSPAQVKEYEERFKAINSAFTLLTSHLERMPPS